MDAGLMQVVEHVETDRSDRAEPIFLVITLSGTAMIISSCRWPLVMS